jgi:hypothetical protein
MVFYTFSVKGATALVLSPFFYVYRLDAEKNFGKPLRVPTTQSS